MDTPVSRYNRHQLLKVLGPEGQKRIEDSRVLVAGLGALGSLIAMLLARAGVGFLRIVDLDEPELHNLHRQLLYDESDLHTGLSKAEVARLKLAQSNSDVEIDAVTAPVSSENIQGLTEEGIDLVVDALDNIRTRYIINDTIVAKGIPYVFGGAIETAGNVMTIIPGRTPCIRCLWPDPAAVENHPTAALVGVLSATATMVASVEVAEALKILVGKEDDVLKGILVMDLWKDTFHVAPAEPDPSCRCRRG